MNPNRLTRDLRHVPGNVWSQNFPGGSLVSAIFDRQLMTWSDRGGASRIFGDVWSDYCWKLLSEQSSAIVEGLTGQRDWIALRLDDVPHIAMQAGRNKLPNPDFLVLSGSRSDEIEIRAIDAKFAIDRVRRSQIGPDSIRDLVEIPGSHVSTLITEQENLDGEATFRFEQGMFLAPRSILNDYYHGVLTSGSRPKIPSSEIQLIDVDHLQFFSSLPEYELMLLLRSVDRLDRLSPEAEIVAGMYYLRLACAASWFGQKESEPLLSLKPPAPVPPEVIFESARDRFRDTSSSAYQLIREWSKSAAVAEQRQEAVRDAGRLPVKMSDLRRMAERAGFGEDRRRIRLLRGSLERRFARRLVEEIGEIPASPYEPISSIVERVRATSQKLRGDTLDHARGLVERFASGDAAAGDGGD